MLPTRTVARKHQLAPGPSSTVRTPGDFRRCMQGAEGADEGARSADEGAASAVVRVRWCERRGGEEGK